MKKEDKVTESRRKILDTSIQEFGSKGYKAASTNEICEVCGISKGLIFYYFKSKRQLFEECAMQCMDEFDQYMQEHFERGNTAMEEIKHCCVTRKDFFISHPYRHRIFCEVLYWNDVLDRQKKKEFMDRYNRHSFLIISKILDNVGMSARFSREKSISCAVKMMELIDMQVMNQYQETEQTEQMLSDQMKQYEVFFEIFLYGILER